MGQRFERFKQRMRRRHELPRTQEEHDAATSRLAAIIKTEGDPFVVHIFESGFMQITFPDDEKGIVTQCPDVETAIQVGRDGSRELRPTACVEVHRVPATGISADWLRYIGMAVRPETKVHGLSESDKDSA